ncbi:MAG: phosphotransferase [Candidatus Eisenbacteria bacterium]|uniref:Phosphotransferase n=1 Tax=Eiseniibacteriota bacterium TaxID=2212470 RepID=A0A956M4C6_UNCEI|nr:phosphotransferase [Candidatus Eisenbacteria bacterium]
MLATALGRSVRIDRIEPIVDYPEAQHCIYRAFLAPDGGLPPTIILKVPQLPGDWLHLERAALEFLREREGTADLVPRIYGCAEDASILAMEDLGVESCLVGRILGEADRDRAERALHEMQRSLARLHGATLGAAAATRFAAIRSAYPPTPPTRHKIHRIDEVLRDLPERFAEIGCAVTPGMEREIAAARAELAEPREFLAFTHGDGTPANSMWVERPPDGRIVFIDFETAGFRHALLDGTFPCIRYLHSVWARTLPRELRRALQRTYRSELARFCPAVEDDLRYRSAIAAASAGWLAGLLAFLPRVADEDVSWGRSTIRQRILAGLDHLTELAHEHDMLVLLREACLSSGAILRAQWPDCSEMEPYESLVAVPGLHIEG